MKKSNHATISLPLPQMNGETKPAKQSCPRGRGDPFFQDTLEEKPTTIPMNENTKLISQTDTAASHTKIDVF